MGLAYETIINGENMKSIQDFVNINVHMLYMYRYNKIETRACVYAIQYINKYSKFSLRDEFMDVINEMNKDLAYSLSSYRYDLTVLKDYYKRYNVLNSNQVTYYVK